MLFSSGAAVGETGQHRTAAAVCGSGYDWAGWARAVKAWHEGCVLQDAKTAAVLDSSSDEEEEEEEEEEGGVGVGGGGGGKDKRAGVEFEEAEGALPGVPIGGGGGMLATFLGQEARFALKCATDKVGWSLIAQTIIIK